MAASTTITSTSGAAVATGGSELSPLLAFASSMRAATPGPIYPEELAMASPSVMEADGSGVSNPDRSTIDSSILSSVAVAD